MLLSEPSARSSILFPFIRNAYSTLKLETPSSLAQLPVHVIKPTKTVKFHTDVCFELIIPRIYIEPFMCLCHPSARYGQT